MKRLTSLLLLLPGLALAQAQEVGPPPGNAETEAGDVAEIDKDATGPLRERIHPVSGKLFPKQGRLELSPSATVSFRDAFFTKYIFGGGLTYHLVETLAVGVRAGYALPVVAGAGQICTFTDDGGTAVGCRAPTFEEVDGRGEGQMLLLGGLDLQWAPIYGKLSLLAESFAHFDLYAIGGVTAVQYAAPDIRRAEGIERELALGANVGVGSRVFLNRWLSLRAELRDVIYQERSHRRLGEPILRNQFLFELGLSVFLPSFVEDR